MEYAGDNSPPTREQMAPPRVGLHLSAKPEQHALPISSDSAIDLPRDVGEVVVSQISVPRACGARRPFSRPARRDYRFLLPIARNPSLRDREDGTIIPELDNSLRSPDSITTPLPQQPSASAQQPASTRTGSKQGRGTESQEKAAGPELKMVTEDGGTIDFTALEVAGDDVYNEELMRRTAGMKSREQLVRFIESLNGNWLNRNQKRMCVDAREFGDVLPGGWKVVVALKRRRSGDPTAPYIYRFISPSGEQFPSCKEVARFLQSQLSAIAANQNNNNVTVLLREEDDDGANNPAAIIVPNQDVVDVTPLHEEEEEEDGVNYSYAARESHGMEIWSSEWRDDDLVDIQIRGEYDCHICNMRFNELTDYVEHRRLH